MSDKPYVRWINCGDDNWRLLVGRGKKPRIVASVWSNGNWHTWDRDGCGAENDCEPSVRQAKVEAAASAIAQGFI